MAPHEGAEKMSVRCLKAVPLSRLLADLPDPRVRGPVHDVHVTGVAEHSSRVTPGTLFACVPGRRDDGHAHAAEAVARGAAALVVERWLPGLEGVPQVLVGSARAAAALAARSLHGRPDARLLVLAVTGTNGKTTTTHMLESIFQRAGRPIGVVGTVGARLGCAQRPAELTTPVSADLYAMLADAVTAGLRGVALEASSHALDQHRLEGLLVDTAVFTNFTRDHLDYHGDAMSYFAAKRRLFAPRQGPKGEPELAVISIDQPAGRLLRRTLPASRRAVTFGFAPDADVRGELRGEHELLISSLWGAERLRLPLPGRHNAANALAAAAAALVNGVGVADVAEGIAAMRGVPGRFERVDAGQPFQVVVDFAHNPDGLACTLRTARALCRRRLIVVFGCKGGDGDLEKRLRMGAVAAAQADACIITTDDPYDEDPAAIAAIVAEGARRRAAGADVRVILDREEAVAEAVDLAGPGDLVVVAGRGHEAWQTVRGERRPLRDRDVCLRALGRVGLAAVAQPAG
jgi:UDP-N-acetylmuramoyl-L-alanyl-D-glutamate--2,6-diaminopimelate ligase